MVRENDERPKTTSERWLTGGLIVLTLLACAIPLASNHADADLWGHVRYGRDVLQFGLPATTTYSYTAEGHRWINHENLAELAFALLAYSPGPFALLGFKCLLGLIVVAMILRRGLRDGVGLTAVCGVTMLSALNLNYFWMMRPQIFSYFYFAVLLALIGYCFRGWEGSWRVPLLSTRWDDPPAAPDYDSGRMRKLWLVPPLMMIWANTHGGFAAGLCIYLVYLGLRSIETLATWGWSGWGVVRRLTMMGTAAVLATLINPYGLGLHRWLAESLGSPRPEITEWHPPDLLHPDCLPLLVLIVAFFVGVLLTRRARDFTHLCLLAATLWQTIEHHRHTPFFAIAFGFWMAPHLESAAQRFGLLRGDDEESDLSFRSRATFGAFVLLGVVGMSLILAQRFADMPVKRSEYPVTAAEFIADRDLNGKMVVTYNWAQYMIDAFGRRDGSEAGIQVAFDGRFRTCYPQALVDMHFDLILGDIPHLRQRMLDAPVDGRRILDHLEPDLALLSRLQPNSELVMQHNREQWTLLYQDELAQLWGRSEVFDDPSGERYLPPSRRTISDAPQTGSVTWPALPRRLPRSGAQSLASTGKASS